MSIENDIKRIADALEALANKQATVAKDRPAAQSAPVEKAISTAWLPFKDKQGFAKYLMDSYTKLGAVKGGEIQGILSKAGFSNTNEVPIDSYPGIYNEVEALKSSTTATQ